MRTLLGNLKRSTVILKDLFFFRIVVVHPENLIKRADVVKRMKWQAVWKTYVLIQHRVRPTKFGNQKEPKDQTHVTTTKILSQTLINNGDIVYCCVLNMLFFVYIFRSTELLYIIYVTRESLELVTSPFNTTFPAFYFLSLS